MNNKLKTLAIATMIGLTISTTGCNIPFLTPEPAVPQSPVAPNPETNPQEEEKAKTAIKKYMEELFKAPTEGYITNIAMGVIPDSIKSKVASRTINEADGNPEMGIHLPRFVELNGLTIINYELSSAVDTSIKSDFVGKPGDKSFLYYTKVDLKAKVLPTAEFLKYYKLNEVTNIYEHIIENNVPKAIDENMTDFIKVQAKYDVEVEQESSDYKVVTQREANNKPGVKSRVFVLNNEFLSRVNYLDEKVAAEKSIYESEKKLIEGYIDGINKLDRERMALLKTKWNLNKDEFVGFLNKSVGVSSASLMVDDTYKLKFPYDSFPIQLGFERIAEVTNKKVLVHPGYSEKNKRYIVKFDAAVVKANGLVGAKESYSFDYYVTLKGSTIDSVSLNEFMRKIPKPKKEEPSPSPVAKK
jgi:hypothetical protein